MYRKGNPYRLPGTTPTLKGVRGCWTLFVFFFFFEVLFEWNVPNTFSCLSDLYSGSCLQNNPILHISIILSYKCFINTWLFTGVVESRSSFCYSFNKIWKTKVVLYYGWSFLVNMLRILVSECLKLALNCLTFISLVLKFAREMCVVSTRFGRKGLWMETNITDRKKI